MRTIVLVFCFFLFGQAMALRIVSLEFVVKGKENDLLLSRKMTLLGISGDQLMETCNKNVLSFFLRHGEEIPDTSWLDSLQLPVLFYKSLLYNSWAKKEEENIYRYVSLHNLLLLHFIAGQWEKTGPFLQQSGFLINSPALVPVRKEKKTKKKRGYTSY